MSSSFRFFRVSFRRLSKARLSGWDSFAAVITQIMALDIVFSLDSVITAVGRLTAPLFYILGRPISGRDLILIGGGLFLLAKATIDIHERLMANEITIMVTAVILAVGVMMVTVGPISSFVHRHPTVKVLALSFLLLIGVSLVGAETASACTYRKATSILRWASQCSWN
jgi:predicted tellurium resistance membrane protein TerC